MKMTLEVWGADPPTACWSGACALKCLCPALFRLDAQGASGAGVACACLWLPRRQARATVWAALLDWLAVHSLPCRASGTCDQGYLSPGGYYSAIVTKQR